MTHRIQIIPADEAHIAIIAPRMRAADVAEVWAAGRRSPHEALALSLEHATHASTVTLDGRPEMMFGVGALCLATGHGVPWLLGTDAVVRHQMHFLREAQAELARMLQTYPVLRNLVDDRNSVSKRWLRWLGFTLFPPEPYGADGALFSPFELRVDHVRFRTGADGRLRCDRRRRADPAGAGDRGGGAIQCADRP
ncbi:hypothetical protein GCM10007276_34380 [Agaricicola taiwanensis]|uniref:Uncharacterized protein n=1 Tax=Agaricicola taiwanensis TaxID=591372 RepID=A0A8J2YMW4_9RHOB|nr:hypothetical protein [Agaricicola taiwanensis]GGE54422.1 hypothetical protein GCM10007276_34380 [Agaricicola taiwanensis]